MDLEALFRDYPEIQVMREEDQKDIASTFAKMPMVLPGFELEYDRSPRVQDLLQCQAAHHLTLVGRLQNQFLGFASLSWGVRYVEGKLQSTAYLADLRVHPSRHAVRLWRKGIGQLIAHGHEYGLSIRHHLTAILAENKAAIRNLTESPSNPFRYHLLQQKIMVNILGRKIWRRPVFSPYELRKTPLARQEELKFIEFQGQAEQKKLFGYNISEEWPRRLLSWPGFAESLIYSCHDKAGKMVMSCIPWSPSSAKRMKVVRMKNWFRWILLVLKLLGLRLPQEGQALEVNYLTHLNFAENISQMQKSQMLAAVVQNLLNEKRWHMISFSDHELLYNRKSLTPFVKLTTPVNLYAVTTKDATPELPQKNISFEMSLV